MTIKAPTQLHYVRFFDELSIDDVPLVGGKVLEVMAEHGLRRGENGLEIYVMCEIPNNVVQVDAFAEIFDGFSIGSNDLTQLALGVDRDSELVAFDFDERDSGVLGPYGSNGGRSEAQRTTLGNLRPGTV